MHISISPRKSHEPLPRIVDELIQIGGTLSQIVSHMALNATSGRSSADAPPVDVVLTGLLDDVLQPLVSQHGDKALAVAADVLAAAGARIADEIMLVPLDEPPSS